MTYREQALVDLDAPARELEVLAELGRRRMRTLGRAIGIGTASGILTGLALTALILLLGGAHFSKGQGHLLAVVTTATTVMGALGGRRVGRRLADLHAPAWLAELAARHKVEPARLTSTIEDTRRL